MAKDLGRENMLGFPSSLGGIEWRGIGWGDKSE